MAQPVPTKPLAQGQREANAQICMRRRLNTQSHWHSSPHTDSHMHVSCPPALLIRPYMFPCYFTSLVRSMLLCVWMTKNGWESGSVLHAICFGPLGSRCTYKVSSGVKGSWIQWTGRGRSFALFLLFVCVLLNLVCNDVVPLMDPLYTCNSSIFFNFQLAF